MIAIMLNDLISKFEAQATSVICKQAGEHLFSRGDNISSMFLLLKGQLKLCRTGLEGGELTLHRVKATNFVAEASLYSKLYHCDAVALEECRIVRMPKAEFNLLLHENHSTIDQWTAHIAHELQEARLRSDILTKRRIDERLNIWLAWNDHKLPQKGQWKELAFELGVSPEALYREIAKRRSKA